MPNKKTTDMALANPELIRVKRIIDFTDGKLRPNAMVMKGDTLLSDKAKSIIGSRSTPTNTKKGWVPFEDRQKVLVLTDGKIVDPERSTNRSSKTKDYIGSYYNWNGPLRPEYDMMEPMAIFDTEAYLKQTINRRLALTFRNGFEVTGRNSDVEYINKRIATMEFVSDRSFRAFMKRIMFCLLLQGNCFLLKIRKDDSSGVPKKEGKPVPVSGYTIIPSHQIQPYMKKGVIDKWRRYYDTGKFFDEYEPKEIVHFILDKKPWHIYGTPRTVAVREDIFALRRLEENTELLFINYLFPLFHVKVGTEMNPATYTDDGMSELDLVKFQIENMPKEGVFVTDERTEVSVVGAQSQVLDFMALLAYYKTRVFAGLGVSELDMGGATPGGSAVSDNISQNLKDSIKADVEEFADQVKYYMFKEWIMEAPHSVGVQPAIAELALVFHEIDLDNRIKEENHVLNLYNNNLVTFPEARKRMRMKPEVDQKELHVNRDTAWLDKITVAHETNAQIQVLKATKDMGLGEQNTTTHKTTNGNTKRTVAITKKTAPKAKAVQNIVTPVNQHGQKIGPGKVGHDSFIWLLKDKLIPACEFLADFTDSDWKTCSSNLIDESFNEFQSLQLDDSEENSYTKQLQEDINNLKGLVAATPDPEELSVILDYALQDDQELVDELNQLTPEEEIVK
jgi:hypothetical protein